METIRAFFALPLPDAVTLEVDEIQHALRDSLGDAVRWIRPERLHITLAFMSALPEAAVVELAERVRAETSAHLAFTCALGGPVYFPSLKRKRVVALPVLDSDAVEALAAAIRTGMAGCGLQVEARPFKGHLTIGRIRRGGKPGTIELEREPMPIRVARFELMQSVLKPDGPEYTVRERFSLM